MKAGTAAKRYARALFSLGLDTGDFEKIGQEIGAVASAIEGNASLKEALLNPLQETGIRRGIVSAIAGKKGFSGTTKNFLLLLVDRDRMSLLPEISRSYQGLSDEKAARMKAIVVTAANVSDALIKELTASLEKKTGKTVTLAQEVDPSIVGGIIVKVGDIVYDGSIRTQLNTIKSNIMKAA